MSDPKPYVYSLIEAKTSPLRDPQPIAQEAEQERKHQPEPESQPEQNSRGQKRPKGSAPPEEPGAKRPKATPATRTERRRDVPGAVLPPMLVHTPADIAAAHVLVLMSSGRTPLPSPPSERSLSGGLPADQAPLVHKKAASPVLALAPGPAQKQFVAKAKAKHNPTRKIVEVDNKMVDKTTANDIKLAELIENKGYVADPSCNSCRKAHRICKVSPKHSKRCAGCCVKKAKCTFAETDNPDSGEKQGGNATRKASASKRSGGGWREMVAQARHRRAAEQQLREPVIQRPSVQPHRETIMDVVLESRARAAAASAQDSAPHPILEPSPGSRSSDQPVESQSETWEERIGGWQTQQSWVSTVGVQTPSRALNTPGARRRQSSDSADTNTTFSGRDVFTPPRQESRTPDSPRSQRTETDPAGQKRQSSGAVNLPDIVADQPPTGL